MLADHVLQYQLQCTDSLSFKSSPSFKRSLLSYWFNLIKFRQTLQCLLYEEAGDRTETLPVVSSLKLCTAHIFSFIMSCKSTVSSQGLSTLSKDGSVTQIVVFELKQG